MIQMHIEYCPYGDLANLFEYHYENDKPIPEPLLWHIFESLVNVGLLMEQGGITQAEAGWTRSFTGTSNPRTLSSVSILNQCQVGLIGPLIRQSS